MPFIPEGLTDDPVDPAEDAAPADANALEIPQLLRCPFEVT